MAQVSAALVKALRERTDMGFMECKKALEESGGDLERAMEILRVKSGAKAQKVAERPTGEGIIVAALSEDGKAGVLVEVNCETDFVAKNPAFIAFAEEAARVALERGLENPIALLEEKAGDKTLDGRRTETVMKLGENVSVSRVALLKAQGRVFSYVHAGKIGVLVDAMTDSPEVGKDLALHVAASKPRWVSRQEVPPEVMDKEWSLARAQSETSGKPPPVVEKMAQGRVEKFLAETVLLEQDFVKSPEMKVREWLLSHAAEVFAFRLLVLGAHG